MEPQDKFETLPFKFFFPAIAIRIDCTKMSVYLPNEADWVTMRKYKPGALLEHILVGQCIFGKKVLWSVYPNFKMFHSESKICFCYLLLVASLGSKSLCAFEKGKTYDPAAVIDLVRFSFYFFLFF